MKIIFSNLIIHNIILRKKILLKSTLISILSLSVALSQENNIDESKDTLIVNKSVKQPLLLNDVKYDASDSIIINQKDNKISLYNNAKIIYGDIELTSGLIILDYKKNEVYAGRISDENGDLSFNLLDNANGKCNLFYSLIPSLLLDQNLYNSDYCFGSSYQTPKVSRKMLSRR